VTASLQGRAEQFREVVSLSLACQARGEMGDGRPVCFDLPTRFLGAGER
jgi:hypothetical protein